MQKNTNNLRFGYNQNPRFVGAKQSMLHPSGFIHGRIPYYLIYGIHLGSFYGR